jgi:urease accessory protein UreF
MTGTLPAYALTPDRMTLVVKRRAPGGVQTVTLHRQEGAGPFTDADVAAALSQVPRAGRQMQPGQRNTTRRAGTRFGTVWTHVMTGPPTWWLPRLKREKDGTLMAGWLRLAVAVKFERRAA